MERRLFLILLALTAIMMVGCDIREIDHHVDNCTIVIIDSCEYIMEQTYMHSIYIHKGNCKYCQERMRKMIEDTRR